MHEGGHGILDGVKKEKHSHDHHHHQHGHDHDHHHHDHDHTHGSDIKAKLIAGGVAAVFIVAFIVWKFLV